MKLLITLSLLSFTLFTFGQNYQCIRSNDLHYFKAHNTLDGYGPMLGLNCDSAEFVAGDSILYPFKQLRQEFVDTTIACGFQYADGWMGSHVIIKPTGTHLFFNKDADTIRLETQAALGDTFLVYTYDTGDSIMAEVTSVTQEMVLGVMDSVKTFTLSSTNAAFNLAVPEFRVGLNSGFVSVLPLYHFPETHDYPDVEEQFHLVGKEFPKTGITKPTYYDVNSLNIGDVVKYEAYNPIQTEYFEKTVASKSYLPNDSVEYVFDINYLIVYQGTGPSDPFYVSDTSYQVTEQYYIANTYMDAYIPGRLYLGYNDLTLHLSYSDDCGFKSVLETWGAYPVDTNSLYCMDNWHGAHQSWTSITRGLEGYYRCDDPQIGGCDFGEIFKYKSNTVETCGENFVVGLEEQILPKISLYPNPVSNQLVIQSDKVWTSYSIMSLEGRVLQNGNYVQSLDVSELPSGIFFLVIAHATGTSKMKFIKR